MKGKTMATLRTCAARVASLFRRREMDARLDEELSFHVEQEARALEAKGLSPDAARRAARLLLAPGGALERIRESHRAGRGIPALEILLQDLRYAARRMRKSPGFTAVALLSLAFGIGTNSAIFCVVDALLLKGLPVPDADRLSVLEKNSGDDRTPLFSYPALLRFQDSGAACTGVVGVTDDFTAVVRPLAARRPGDAAASGRGGGGGLPVVAGGITETADAQLVSGNLFSVLGVVAAAGRTFTASEDAVPGGHLVAVISYGYWQKRFGRDPAVLGQPLVVNGAPVTIVGVLPRGFRGVIADVAPDVFLPVTLHDAVRFRGSMRIDGPNDFSQPVWNQVNEHWLQLLAKRRGGVSLAKERAVLDVLYEREKQAEMAGRTNPDDRRQLRAQRLLVEPGWRGLAEDRETLTRPLLILLSLAGLVLVIACTNVATLLLARADRRRKEMAVRLGIGAGRARVLRQLVAESLLLAGLGGALGLGFAVWGSRLLLRLVSQGADPVALDVDLDWRKVGFALGVALATGLAFGLVPALQATRVDLAAVLQQGSRGVHGTGRGGHRLPLGRALVAAQVGLSLVLLIGAGLFVRSLQNLMRVDPGYVTGGLVTARIDPTLEDYPAGRAVLYERLVERLQAIPGVRSASLSLTRLLTGSMAASNISLPGYNQRPSENMDVQRNCVTPRYFATVGLTLVAGRTLGPGDRNGTPRVAVVNQAMVRRFLPPGPAIGRRFGFGGPNHAREIEIVGVVKDSKYHQLDELAPPLVYLAAGQFEPGFHDAEYLRDVELRVDPAAGQAAVVTWAAAELRRAVAEVAPGLPVLSITTMSEQLDRSLARERAVARLTGFFGLLALLLAAIGLYGVMSFSVARRAGEIGLRMALGAERGEVLVLVMRETLAPVAIGVAAGFAVSWGLGRLAANQLFGLSAHDPATLAGATAALVLVALLAGYLPSRRAAAVEPMQALRDE
jgi:predicted permease